MELSTVIRMADLRTPPGTALPVMQSPWVTSLSTLVDVMLTNAAVTPMASSPTLYRKLNTATVSPLLGKA